jgi:putative intracellular protease/amidase
MPRLLFLVSSARELALADGTMHETGYFAEEALTPYERFREAGIEVDVATPDGHPPHADSYGLEPIFHYPDEDEDFLASITRSFAHDVDDIRLTLRHLTEVQLIAARRVFLALQRYGVGADAAREAVARAARTAWEQDRGLIDVLAESDLPAPIERAELEAAYQEVVEDSRLESNRVRDALAALPGFQAPLSLASLSDAELARYDAVFAPGGHGPMVDLADNPDVGRLLRLLHDKQAPIASLCHGPALLLSAPANLDGQWIFDGYRVTAFTNEEEYQTPPGKLGMSWLLETALRNAGAVFDDARAAWTSHVVVDRGVITAQNPNSADAAAVSVLKALQVL